MKLGLLTFWRSPNYGAVLQALALAKFLQRHGHDVSMIGYSQPMDAGFARGPLWYLGFKNELGSGAFKKLIVGVIRLLCEVNVCGALFRLFATRKLLRQYFCYPILNYRDYDDFAQHFDLPVALIGSDQVWSPNFMNLMGEGYLLERMPDSVKRVSYAAAISSEDFVCDATGIDWADVFRRALTKFKAVSVREFTLIPALNAMLDGDVFWAVDPTLLFDGMEWRSLLGIPQKEQGRHITIYWLSDMKPCLSSMLSFARAQSCPVHLFTDMNTLRLGSGVGARSLVSYLSMRIRILLCKNLKVRRAGTARDLVADISTAEGVVADSFHALMFSTIFRRNVKIVIPPSRVKMASRMKDFLKRVGWGNVLVPALTDDLLQVESDTVIGSCANLQKWIDESKSWLLTAIDRCSRE